jgi:Domain of Unknown Function (DUF1259)
MQGSTARIGALIALGAALLVGIGTASAAPRTTQVDWTAVGNAIGIQGTVQSDGVYKVGLPRTDLHVHIRGVQLAPSFALGGYLVFQSTVGSNAMMMGDLVLTQNEIEPVMSKLEQGGIEITALHNHLIGTQPLVMYMHVMGQGDAVQLATAAHDALTLSHTPLKAAPTTPKDQTVDLDTAALDSIIGAKGKVDHGVYKYTFAPKYAVTEDGMTLAPSMGITTGLAFQPIHQDQEDKSSHHSHGHKGKGPAAGGAAITGDFALLASQVNPVIRALRANNIDVTALHSHMLDTSPTQFFMHFYATGDPLVLARGLRAALDAMG